MREIGSVAAQALLNQIGDDNYRPCRLILKPELVVRASTDPAAAQRHALRPASAPIPELAAEPGKGLDA